jgi:hypothetical protein
MTETARRLWTVAEPYHALTYFAPEAHQAFVDAGLRGFWRGYFAGRAAPLGPVPAGVVTAAFFGFHPGFVARAVPSVWSVVEPAAAITARLDGVEHATDRIFGDTLDHPDVIAAIDAIRAAVSATPVAGRPLFAANAALGWPERPALALWHATTLLREHRGDGHVASLVAAAIGPCDAHVLRIADDDLPLDSIQPYRGWDGSDWERAADRLRARGWLDAAGRITTAGRDARAAVEAATDRLSAGLVHRIDGVERVVGVLRPLADRIREDAVVPYPNPIGVPAPR